MHSAPLPRESLTWRVSWLTFAKTAGFAFSIALPLLLVRRMDQVQYGLYKQAFLVVTTAMTVLPLGVNMSAFYFLARERERRRETVLNILLFNAGAGLLACGALFFYPSVLTAIFHSPLLAQYSRWIGVTVLLWICGGFLEMAPIANEEIRLAAAFIVATQATRALIFVTAALWFPTVRSVLAAAILHGFLQTVALILYLQSRFPGFWRCFDGRMLRSQLSYAIPLGWAALLLTMETDLHNYFVSNQFGPAMFALYTIGTLQLPLMGLIQEATNSVLITRVSVLQQRGEHREIVDLMARAARKLAAVYFPVYALLLVVGREFIRVLFTSRYSDAWPIWAINLTLLPLGVVLLDPLFRAYETERYFLLRLRIGLVAALILALWLWTARLGLVGVIGMVVMVNAVERGVAAIHFARLLGVGRRDIVLLRDTGKLAFAAAIAGLASAAVRLVVAPAAPLVVLAAGATVFTLAYLAAIHFLGVLSVQERGRIRTIAARYLPAPLRYRLD
jgi:O-antigen/teichoic acid export membrane protein